MTLHAAGVSFPAPTGYPEKFRVSGDGQEAAMPHELRKPYSALTSAPASARSDLAEYLASEGCSDLIPIAALLVSELVTNAYLYATGPIVLHAVFTAGILHVEVDDCTRVTRHRDARDGHGRGLHIVNTLATASGHRQRNGSGRTSWFELVA